MLSIASDYACISRGEPLPYIARIANAGFTHIHWCHQWDSDFVYSKSEIDQIAAWLREFNLTMLDLHGSVGPEKNWGSPAEYQRLAGVELVANRIEMTARLGGDAVVMHVPNGPLTDATRRSLDTLAPLSQSTGVRIAIENWELEAPQQVLTEYSPDYVGLCYDSGHGNMRPDGMDVLEKWKHRLIAMHLHDNDGSGDQHRIIGNGTVDWQRLAKIIATSSYHKCLNTESCNVNEQDLTEEVFLQRAFAALSGVDRLVEEERSAGA